MHHNKAILPIWEGNAAGGLLLVTGAGESLSWNRGHIGYLVTANEK